eukprot:COSAG01_NODE_12200_length_1781_cov_54.099881_1_plen_36_part_01
MVAVSCFYERARWQVHDQRRLRWNGRALRDVPVRHG